MKLVSLCSILAGFLLMSACQDARSKSLEAIAVQKEALEKTNDSEPIPPEERHRLTTALIAQYQTFMDQYPDDTACEAFAFDAGIHLESLGKFREAITMYDRIWQKEPDHRLAPIAHYRTGFISEKMLRDNSMAEERYSAFAQRYPDHPMAKQMELQLQYLGNDEGLLNAILSGELEIAQP